MHLKTDTSKNSHFAQVPTISHPRNTFSISDKHVTTVQFDYLYPLYHKFIYPGDTLNVTLKALSRLTTQIRPLFDDLYIDVHAWFVPHRLVQTNWARFQFNAQPLGPTQDNSALTTPKLRRNELPSFQFQPKSLYDYFGYPTLVTWNDANQHINNYLARSYNLIWNLNYRDENLQNPAVVDLDEGPDHADNYVLRRRGKRHDKFTSALPWQQKGVQPSLPLGTMAPVNAWTREDGFLSSFPLPTPGGDYRWTLRSRDNLSAGNLVRMRQTAGSINTASRSTEAYPSSNWAGSGEQHLMPNFTNDYLNLGSDTDIFMMTNLGLAVGNNLQLLRNSLAIQHLFEADARGGTRDVESIQHRWGVTVPDFRLQRPEYLGGATYDFDGHIIPQSSESGTTPQGFLTQFSQSLNAFNVNHSFVEHGSFMILISHRSNITYQQGLQRELSYKTRFDFYQPEFSNLGEVAIRNQEIFYSGIQDEINDLGTFGFQEYGYELRYGENRVSAEMRSNYSQSLDSQHMADDYASLPTLGGAWIQSNTDIGRNIAVQPNVADPIQLNTIVQGMIARTLPMYSIPGLTRL